MANTLNKIEITGEHKHLQIREVTDSGGYHRRVLTPDMDVSSEVQEIKDKAENLDEKDLKNRVIKASYYKVSAIKENITKTGVSKSGIPIYTFNYKNDNQLWSGTMAQDLLELG